MAINFPNTPALNELYSENGYTWKWSGTSWTNVTTTAGTPGAQGIQGVQGLLGVGLQGSQGPAGSSQGTQGTQGNLGTQGTSGAGSQGVQGLAGSAQGTQGTFGTQGTSGAGSQGVQGLAGSAQGTQGTQGTQGRQGTQGTLGAQGPAGTAQGTQGATGAGGGSPPGSDTQVVYNNAGAYGAAATVNYFSGNTTLLSTGNVRFTGNVVATPSLSISADSTFADNAAGKVIVVDTSGGAKTVTFAPASVSGFAITVVRKGSGNLTIAASGVTKYNSASYISGNVSSSNSGATVIYTATNEIYLIGDIESSSVGSGAQGAQGTAGAGGGSPPGSDTQLTYNNAGSYGATGTVNYYSGNTTLVSTGNVRFTSNIASLPSLSISTNSTYADNAAGKVIIVDTSGGDKTITFAPALYSGFGISVVRKGSGNLTIATSGVTKINSASYLSSNIAASNSGATVVYTATNEIYLIGDIESALATGAQGVQGPAGSSQGTQGTQGRQGTQGVGSQGVQGLAGSAQGTQGTFGTQGTSGAGSQGVQGLAGSAQGTQGTSGAGSQGVQGLAGSAQGTQGTQGTFGTQGTSGTGSQGVQGATGGGGGGSISVTDETASSSTYYPSLSTVTTGTLTTVNVSSTKLTFTPSTGTLNATAFNSLSDRRAKTNIESLPYGLTDVLNLEPKKFQMKDTGLVSIGLIAQEVENIIPEVVHIADEYKGINYSVLVAVLINAIKELNAEIQELKNK